MNWEITIFKLNFGEECYVERSKENEEIAIQKYEGGKQIQNTFHADNTIFQSSKDILLFHSSDPVFEKKDDGELGHEDFQIEFG